MLGGALHISNPWSLAWRWGPKKGESPGTHGPASLAHTVGNSKETLFQARWEVTPGTEDT